MAGRLLSAMPRLLGRARNTVFLNPIIRGFGISSNRNAVFSNDIGRGLDISSHRKTVFSHPFERRFSVSSPLMDRTHVNWVAKEDVAVVHVNDPNSVMNTWSGHMQKEMMEVMDEIWTNNAVESAVVVSSKPECFIAGVDLKMVKACKTKEEATLLSQDWQKMMERIENSPKPIVAAINGWCLNGGLEFVTACQYRLATSNIKTSLVSREVRLGLLPSAGGTQRLAKLIGPKSALELMLEGNRIPADVAKKMGLVHKVVDTLDLGHLEKVAIDCAREIVKKGIPPTSQKDWAKIAHDFYYSFPRIRQDMYSDMQAKVVNKETFCTAPLKIIETVQTGVERGSVAGYRAESQNFGELAMNDVTHALIRLYSSLILAYQKKDNET